jgi:hypothetical protein
MSARFWRVVRPVAPDIAASVPSGTGERMRFGRVPSRVRVAAVGRVTPGAA